MFPSHMASSHRSPLKTVYVVEQILRLGQNIKNIYFMGKTQNFCLFSSSCDAGIHTWEPVNFRCRLYWDSRIFPLVFEAYFEVLIT